MVFGCIAKSITDHDVKQLLRILVRALESFSDINLIEAIVMCLTRLHPLLSQESPIHKSLFWVAISILQLDEIALYASGLALLEQNLLTLESQGAFEHASIADTMLTTREPLEWYFKQLDHSVGVSFKANFHFALVGHLIKGYRHPSPTTVSRTTRVLTMLLDIVAKPAGRDRYEVTKENVAYLAALVSVSEDVRSRCHVKHTFSDIMPDSPTLDSFAVDSHLKRGAAGAAGGDRRQPNSGLASPVETGVPVATVGVPADVAVPAAFGQRQKSLELMEQPPTEAAKGASAVVPPPPRAGAEKRPTSIATRNQVNTPEEDAQQQQPQQQQLPQQQQQNAAAAGAGAATDHTDADSGCGDDSPPGEDLNYQDRRSGAAPLASNDDTGGGDAGRPSISNENNILLDPDVLTDQVTQVLVLTVMATLVKYTTDESEVRILYEYLAEASVVFPKVFPVIHSLLDAKITNVLSLCHDKTILAAVQSIIENMIACEDDKSQQQLHYLQSLGFGGLWRFAGPFTQANCNAENVELFLNTLEALVETCLPADEQDENVSYNSLLSVSSNIKMSSSLTSLSLGSPTEKTASQSNNPF